MGRNRSHENVFVFLMAATFCVLVYMALFGERIPQLSWGLELATLAAGMICGVVIFLWMLTDCILSKRVENKALWLFLFLVGTYITGMAYYWLVYRRSGGSTS